MFFFTNVIKRRKSSPSAFLVIGLICFFYIEKFLRFVKISVKDFIKLKKCRHVTMIKLYVSSIIKEIYMRMKCIIELIQYNVLEVIAPVFSNSLDWWCTNTCIKNLIILRAFRKYDIFGSWFGKTDVGNAFENEIHWCKVTAGLYLEFP